MRDHALHRRGGQRQLPVRCGGGGGGGGGGGPGGLEGRTIVACAALPGRWAVNVPRCTPQSLSSIPFLPPPTHTLWPRSEEVVHVLQSSTPEDMERNVEQLAAWARSYRPSS